MRFRKPRTPRGRLVILASLPLDVLAVYLGWNSGGICGIVKKIDRDAA